MTELKVIEERRHKFFEQLRKSQANVQEFEEVMRRLADAVSVTTPQFKKLGKKMSPRWYRYLRAHGNKAVRPSKKGNAHR